VEEIRQRAEVKTSVTPEDPWQPGCQGFLLCIDRTATGLIHGWPEIVKCRIGMTACLGRKASI
jgi:hypothetical protein